MEKTIEERYEEIKGLDYRSDTLAMLAMTLIDDLMAERGKMKERIDRGKQSLSELAIDLQFADNEVKTKAQIVDVCTKALDALPALEARVEELEKEVRKWEDYEKAMREDMNP